MLKKKRLSPTDKALPFCKIFANKFAFALKQRVVKITKPVFCNHRKFAGPQENYIKRVAALNLKSGLEEPQWQNTRLSTTG